MKGETDESAIYLSDVSPHDKPWDKHRASAEVVQKLYSNSEFQKYSDRINLCSRQLRFALEAQDDGEIRYRLRQARFCRVRLCPVCQWRRSMMWRARFFEAIPRVMKDYPKARFIFLTLTVKNCEITELRDTIKHLNAGWQRLSQRKAFPAVGWVKSIEVTRNGSDRTAHPHLHAVLMVRPSYFKTGYISQKKWSELWQKCLRTDYTPLVHVQTVKGGNKGSEGDISEGILHALLETLKYGVKESDLISDVEWLHELTVQLQKTRAVSVGGILKEYLNAEEPDDLIHDGKEALDNLLEELEPTNSVWFGWREMVKKYAKNENK